MKNLNPSKRLTSYTERDEFVLRSSFPLAESETAMLLTVYTTSSSNPGNQAKTSDFICRLLPDSLNRARIVKIRKRFKLLPATVRARLPNT